MDGHHCPPDNIIISSAHGLGNEEARELNMERAVYSRGLNDAGSRSGALALIERSEAGRA